MVKTIDPVDFAKGAARILHREVASGNSAALARVRTLGDLRALDDAALVERVRRRHCLATVAAELGFGGWSHLIAVLDGGAATDYGTCLCPPGMDAYWNIWSAQYDEARGIRAEHGGYLLAYKRHYFIVDRHYIAALGLDPDDTDWERIGRNWVDAGDREARRRLYGALFEKRLHRS